jgi:hypothetical protein
VREVSERLFVGNAGDFEMVRGEPNFGVTWAVLQCAKEPWHREALGYTGRGAPKDSAEYLWAYRGNRLILNMVDAPKAEFFPAPMIEEGIGFIRKHLVNGSKVLVHCNQGNSRAPSMALIYMGRFGLVDKHYDPAMAHFRSIYPSYEPGPGMEEFMRQEFAEPLRATA